MRIILLKRSNKIKTPVKMVKRCKCHISIIAKTQFGLPETLIEKLFEVNSNKVNV